MSFEVIEDRFRNRLQPMEWDSTAGGRFGIVLLTPWKWGGVTSSGIFIDHETEDVPDVYGVIQAILHSSPYNVLNLPRERGGLMPGDLVLHTRYATAKVSELALETDELEDLAWRNLGVVTRHTYPLVALAESEIQCRIDGVLADPWAMALSAMYDVP